MLRGNMAKAVRSHDVESLPEVRLLPLVKALPDQNIIPFASFAKLMLALVIEKVM